MNGFTGDTSPAFPMHGHGATLHPQLAFYLDVSANVSLPRHCTAGPRFFAQASAGDANSKPILPFRSSEVLPVLICERKHIGK